MSVEQKVKSIIVEQLGVDASEVTPEASFTDDLGADSLDIVELDEATLSEQLPTLYLLAGEAIPIGAAKAATSQRAGEDRWKAMSLAFVQGYLGDTTSAILTLSEAANGGSDSEGLAHLCWAYVLVGNVESAIDLAWRIDDPDIRAFALLPAVAALADRGEFASARDLAETMFH